VAQQLGRSITAWSSWCCGSMAPPGRRVTLAVRWHVHDKTGKELVLKRSTIGEPITDDGYQPLIRGMNRLLATLAREIATEILSRADTPSAKS